MRKTARLALSKVTIECLYEKSRVCTGRNDQNAAWVAVAPAAELRCVGTPRVEPGFHSFKNKSRQRR